MKDRRRKRTMAWPSTGRRTVKPARMAGARKFQPRCSRIMHRAITTCQHDNPFEASWPAPARRSNWHRELLHAFGRQIRIKRRADDGLTARRTPSARRNPGEASQAQVLENDRELGADGDARNGTQLAGAMSAPRSRGVASNCAPACHRVLTLLLHQAHGRDSGTPDRSSYFVIVEITSDNEEEFPKNNRPSASGAKGRGFDPRQPHQKSGSFRYVAGPPSECKLPVKRLTYLCASFIFCHAMAFLVHRRILLAYPMNFAASPLPDFLYSRNEVG